MDIETFAGVDVSKGWLDYAVRRKKQPSTLKFRFDNNPAGFRAMLKALRENGITVGKKVLITLESSGVYGTPFMSFVTKKKCNICLESALHIKKSIGLQRGKNDALDAERILEYSIRNEDRLRIWIEPRKPVTQLKDLLTMRERIIRVINAIKVPLMELKPTYKRNEWLKLLRFNKPSIEGLSMTLENVEHEIDSIIKSDKEIRRQVNLLMSVPGIGRVTALNLICRTNEFRRYKAGKQLACLAGVAPFEYSSGKVTGKGHVSFHGDKTIKKYLHMGAMSVLTSKNSELRKYFDRKVAEGKHKMLVINNIRNKILLRVAAVIRRGKPYEP